MSDSMQDVEVILTFDDGPHAGGNPNHTKRVKNKLNSHSCRGVFFIQSHARGATAGSYYRGKHPNGTAALREVIADGHLVEVHTGFDYEAAHDWDHIERLTQPSGDDFQGGLPQDLEQCKSFINGLSRDHTAQFVRPVEGEHNAAVRARYADAGLSLVMWDIDSKDTQGYTPTEIRNHLRTEVRNFLDRDIFQIVVLFHEVNRQTYTGNNLDSYIQAIKETIDNYTDNDDPEKEFTPVFNPSKNRIREIFRQKWQN